MDDEKERIKKYFEDIIGNTRYSEKFKEACNNDQMILSVIVRKSDNKIMSIKSLNNDLLDYSDEGKDILND